MSSPLDDDAFSRAACSVLDAGGLHASAVADRAEAWLQDSEEADREPAWTVRLAARVLVRNGAVPTAARAQSLVTPIVVGPTLALAASLLPNAGEQERMDLLLEGIRTSARVGPSDFVFASRLTGEALAAFGSAAVPEIARQHGFADWPGGLTGLCLSAAQLVRADGAHLAGQEPLLFIRRLQEWIVNRS